MKEIDFTPTNNGLRYNELVVDVWEKNLTMRNLYDFSPTPMPGVSFVDYIVYCRKRNKNNTSKKLELYSDFFNHPEKYGKDNPGAILPSLSIDNSHMIDWVKLFPLLTDEGRKFAFRFLTFNRQFNLVSMLDGEEIVEQILCDVKTLLENEDKNFDLLLEVVQDGFFAADLFLLVTPANKVEYLSTVLDDISKVQKKEIFIASLKNSSAWKMFDDWPEEWVETHFNIKKFVDVKTYLQNSASYILINGNA